MSKDQDQPATSASDSQTQSAQQQVPDVEHPILPVLGHTRQKINVPAHVASILVQLLRGWQPIKEIPKFSVKKLVWGDRDFSEVARTVTFHGAQLQVNCATTEEESSFRDLAEIEANNLINKELRGECDNGLIFQASFAATGKSHMRLGPEASRSAEIEGLQWTIAPRDGTPSVWVCEIEGKLEPLLGNLNVAFDIDEHRRYISTTNFALHGTYWYYLVCNDTSWYLLVDTDGHGMPDKNSLWNDFLSLEFVLGRQLDFLPFCGISTHGEAIAYGGGFHRAESLSRNVAQPVPQRKELEAPFFEALSRAFREQPALRLGIPIQSYLDSLTNNIEASYLRIQVALEAFAYWILKTRGELDKILVKDVKAWEGWVRGNKEIILSHGKDQKLAESLYIKVKGAYERATGKIVRDAFKLFGYETTNEMDKEVRQRDLSVHMMQMAPDGLDIDREVRRLHTVRALLVAMVASAVGYSGSLEGEEYLGDGKWWIATLNRSESPIYLAEEPTKIKPYAAQSGNTAVQALLKEVAREEIIKITPPTKTGQG